MHARDSFRSESEETLGPLPPTPATSATIASTTRVDGDAPVKGKGKGRAWHGGEDGGEDGVGYPPVSNEEEEERIVQDVSPTPTGIQHFWDPCCCVIRALLPNAA